MRVVFMGTPEFAVPSLHALAQAHDVIAVYTRPDSASRRGSQTHPSAVKIAALEHGLRVCTPKTLRAADVQADLAADAPDVVVVAAYGLILPPEVLAIPRLGCINVHASLLPRWRGAAPIQRAILAGDTVTGVSIMRMEEGLDTGPFCKTAQVVIADKTAVELTHELSQAGARALMEALVELDDGRCEWTYQNDSEATYAAKIEKSDVVLAPSLGVTEAIRRVRASSLQAPARAVIAGRGVAVVSATPSDVAQEAGCISANKSGVMLGLRDGAIELDRLRPDGKPEMSAADWARGLRHVDAEHWTSP